MHFFYAPDITDSTTYRISEKESHHIIHVKRAEIGDHIFLTDGKGNSYEAELTEITKKYGIVKILSRRQHIPKKYQIHIAIAPPKTGDRLDFLLEKLTEVGADSITPLETRNSERRKFDRDKEEYTLIAAIKQSGNPFLPKLSGMTDFQKFIVSTKNLSIQKYICFCSEDNKPLLSNLYQTDGDVIICIGPEGDFTQEEITFATEHQFIPASLGERIMRTETAGFASCMIVNTINQIRS